MDVNTMPVLSICLYSYENSGPSVLIIWCYCLLPYLRFCEPSFAHS
jgi:hypothetical protein